MVLWSILIVLFLHGLQEQIDHIRRAITTSLDKQKSKRVNLLDNQTEQKTARLVAFVFAGEVAYEDTQAQ